MSSLALEVRFCRVPLQADCENHEMIKHRRLWRKPAVFSAGMPEGNDVFSIPGLFIHEKITDVFP